MGFPYPADVCIAGAPRAILPPEVAAAAGLPILPLPGASPIHHPAAAGTHHQYIPHPATGLPIVIPSATSPYVLPGMSPATFAPFFTDGLRVLPAGSPPPHHHTLQPLSLRIPHAPVTPPMNSRASSDMDYLKNVSIDVLREKARQHHLLSDFEKRPVTASS